MSALRRAALSATLPLVLLSSCDLLPESDRGRVTTVLRKVETPGEVDLLLAEDARKDVRGQLARHLRASNAKTRARAAISVGRMKLMSAENELIRLADDPARLVRSRVAWALGRLATPAAEDTLVRLLEDESNDVRLAALKGLALFPPGRLPVKVLDLLDRQGEDPVARALLQAALEAAGRRGDPAAVGAVAQAASHDDPEVRWRAAWALGRLGSAEAAPTLRWMLTDPDARSRAMAVRGLGALRDSGAATQLIAALDDPDDAVSAQAAVALGSLRVNAAAQPLGELATNSPVPLRRFAALNALASSGLNTAALARLAKDESPWVRAEAVRGLARARQGGAVARAAKDEDWRVRAAAAEGLGRLRRTEALAEMLYDADARVVPSVLRGLARTDYPRLQMTILKHLEDNDIFVRAEAARLVADKRIKRGIDNLLYSWELFTRDQLPDARMAILDALAKLGPRDPRAIEQIKAAYFSKNWVLQNHAYRLLERLRATGELPPPDRVNTLRTESYYDWILTRADFEYLATMETDEGPVVFRLYPKSAPLSVAHFEYLCDAHVYDDMPFHRLESGISLLAGDPRGDGLAGHPVWVRDEPVLEPFGPLSLGLRRGDAPDSATSIFFVTYLPRPELEGENALLGELIEGEDIFRKLGPGSMIRSFRVDRRAFKGEFETRVAELDPPEPEPTPPPAVEGSKGPPQPVLDQTEETFRAPPAFKYLAGVGVIVLALGLVPVGLSRQRRAMFPRALWIVILIIIATSALYMVFAASGHMYNELTQPWPGERLPGEPNPPKVAPDTALLASYVLLGYTVLGLGVVFLLAIGSPLGRYMGLVGVVVNIVLLVLSIHFRVHWILANGVIVAMLFMGWLLVMDKRTDQFFTS